MSSRPAPFGLFGAAAGSAIFQLIREAGPLARADIGRITGLSKSTVSQHVERLLRLGLVTEEPDARYPAGRKRKQLVFNESAGYVVAINLGATSVDIALCDLGASVLEHRELLDVAVSDGPQRVLGRIVEQVDDLLAKHAITPDQLYGMGMGVPGPVEFSTGHPIHPPIMPGWHKYPIKEFLAERYGCLVYIDNDVNVMAVGEAKYGAGVGVENQLFVKIGSGIGCGVILGGRLYRGTHGCAGDIGHISLRGNEELCSCGNRGCLEAIASGRALGRLGTRLAMDGESFELAQVLTQKGTVSAEDIAYLARRGDPLSLSLLRMSGQAIGEVLAGIINFINPSLIVVGGGVSKSGQRLIATIKEVILSKSTPLATSTLEVVPSKLGGMAGVIGAAALVVDEVFSQERVFAMVNQEGMPSAGGD